MGDMFQLKGCEKCGGDLLRDDPDWQCFQCGTYYYSTAPMIYFPKREGVWGNARRVSANGGTAKTRRVENKSMKKVVGV